MGGTAGSGSATRSHVRLSSAGRGRHRTTRGGGRSSGTGNPRPGWPHARGRASDLAFAECPPGGGHPLQGPCHANLAGGRPRRRPCGPGGPATRIPTGTRPGGTSPGGGSRPACGPARPAAGRPLAPARRSSASSSSSPAKRRSSAWSSSSAERSVLMPHMLSSTRSIRSEPGHCAAGFRSSLPPQVGHEVRHPPYSIPQKDYGRGTG